MSPVISHTDGTTGLLTWAPPDGWESYSTATINDSNSDQAVNLDVSTDYKVVISGGHATTQGQVIVNGGRNVVICQPDGGGGHKLGGRITVNDPGSDPGTDKPALGFREHWNGDPSVDGRVIHVEGVLFDGDWLNDMVAEGDPAAIIQVQNCHAVRLWGSQEERHADVFQPYQTFKESRLDMITATTGYQGLMLKADFNAPQGIIYLRRVNIHGVTGETKLMWWSKEGDGPIRVEAGTVWFNHPDRAFGTDEICFVDDSGAGSNNLMTENASSDARGTYTVFPSSVNDADGNEMHRNWDDTATARVYEGTPPGGDYCASGTPGTSYVSPGYEP